MRMDEEPTVMTDIAGRRQKGRLKTRLTLTCLKKRHGHCGSQRSRGDKHGDIEEDNQQPHRRKGNAMEEGEERYGMKERLK